LAWDALIGVLILYSVVAVPLHIGFEIDPKAADNSFDTFVDVMFAVDMILTFFTAVEEDGKLVVDYKAIARSYLYTWFFPDLVSTFPFDSLLPLLVSGVAPNVLRSFKLVRILRLFRLLKVFRIMRLNRKMKDAKVNELFHPIFYTMTSLLAKITLMAHVLCCMFYWVSGCLDLSKGDIWLECGHDNLSSKYILAMYWTMLTMLGVGYGDVVLTTDSGRLYSVLVMVIGSIVFGFIVATVSDSVRNINPRETAKKLRMDEISEYITEKKINKDLKVKIWRHFEYYYNKLSTFPEEVILESMPIMLQQLVLESTRGGLSSLKLFRKQDYGALSQVMPYMRPMFVEPRETIILEGDYVVDCFFVIQGTVHAYQQNLLTEKKLVLVGIYASGSDFGLVHAMRCSSVSWATYKATVLTDLMWLSHDHVKKICRASTVLNDLFVLRANEEAQSYEEIGKHVNTFQNVSDLHVPSYILCDGEVISCRNAIRMLGEGITREKTVKVYKTVRLIGVSPNGKEIYEDNQETSAEMWQRWVINPNGTYKSYFDMVIATFCVMCLITLPYRIGFGIKTTKSWYVIDVMTELLFFADIVVSFLTAYEQSDFSLHTAHKNIAKRYLRSWFIVDFFSTVPFYRFGSAPRASNLLRILKTLKLFRLFRFFRIFRLFRVVKFFQYLFAPTSKFNSEAVIIEDVVTRIAKLMIYLAFITHVTACGWAWISLSRGGETWYSAVDIPDNANLDKYIASIYWTYATMATVGYGDIHAQNDAERLYSIFVMVMGSNILAYIVGIVSANAFNRTGAKGMQEQKLSLVRDYLTEQGTPKLLREAVMKHFCFAIEVRTPFRELQLWKNMPHRIRSATIMFGNAALIKKIPLFQNMKDSVISVIYSLTDPCLSVAGAYVYNYETGSGGIYFILDGIAEVVDDGDSNEEAEVIVSEIPSGNIFGQEKMLNRDIDFVGIRAKTELYMLCLSEKNLEKLKVEFPYAYTILYNHIIQAMNNPLPMLNKIPSMQNEMKETLQKVADIHTANNSFVGRGKRLVSNVLGWVAEDVDDTQWIAKKAVRSRRNSSVGLLLRKKKPSEVLSINCRDRFYAMKKKTKIYPISREPHAKIHINADNSKTLKESQHSIPMSRRPSGRNIYATLYGSNAVRMYSPRQDGQSFSDVLNESPKEMEQDEESQYAKDSLKPEDNNRTMIYNDVASPDDPSQNDVSETKTTMVVESYEN
jgi:CRP-like cAMP-binding protein